MSHDPTPPEAPTVEARRLGELVNGHPEHVAASVPRLVELLTVSTDPDVVREVVRALGHAWDPSAATVLVEHVPVDHPDPQVRLALAQALPGGVPAADDPEDDPEDDADPLRRSVVERLVALTADEEARVRDWAAFGLGAVQARGAGARDALADLLDDPDDDARCEALVALARAGDARAHPALRSRLDAEGPVSLLELEAAAAVAAPDLHAPLAALAQVWAGDEDEFSAPLRLALSRCAPGAAGRAAHVEVRLLEQVRSAVPPGVRVDREGTYPRTSLLVTPPGGPALRFDLWSDGEDPRDGAGSTVVAAVLGTFGAV